MSYINIRIYFITVLILFHFLFYFITYNIIVISSTAIFLLSFVLVLLPEDDVRQPKHIGESTLSLHIYILHAKVWV